MSPTDTDIRKLKLSRFRAYGPSLGALVDARNKTEKSSVRDCGIKSKNCCAAAIERPYSVCGLAKNFCTVVIY